MAVQLREPFFLRGRKSVLQRAVMMSVALGGLASFAAWGVSAIASVMERLVGMADLIPTLVAAWPILITALVYGPIQYHYCRPWWIFPLTVTGWYAALAIFALGLHLCPPVGNGLSVSLFGFPATAAMSGLLLLRRAPIYRLSWGLAVCGSVVAALMILVFDASEPIGRAWLGYAVFALLGRAAILGSWLAAMTVPWGLAFWWPPKPDAPAAEPT